MSIIVLYSNITSLRPVTQTGLSWCIVHTCYLFTLWIPTNKLVRLLVWSLHHVFTRIDWLLILSSL